MLVTLLLVPLLLFLCGLPGWLLLARLPGATGFRRMDLLLLAPWVGLALVTPLLLLLSLLLPLSPLAGLVLLALLVPAAKWGRRPAVALPRGLARLLPLLLLSLLVGTLASLQPPYLFDTGKYHHPAIQILGDHGTVPGQALVEPRLSFSTQWFTLVAPLNHGPLRGRVTALPGAIMASLLLVHLLVALGRSVRGTAGVADYFMAYGVLGGVYVLRHFWHTPSPDLPVAGMILACGWLILLRVRSAGAARLRLWVLLPLAATALAWKATGVVAVAGAGFLWAWTFRREPLMILRGGLLGLAFTLPMVAQGVLSSGVVMFPAGPRLGFLPWAFSPEVVAWHHTYTHNWAWYGGGEAEALPFLRRLATLTDIRGARLGLSVLAGCLVAGLALLRAAVPVTSRHVAIGVTTLAAYALFFLHTPADRFLAGGLLAFPALGFALLAARHQRVALGLLVLLATAHALSRAITLVLPGMILVLVAVSWWGRGGALRPSPRGGRAVALIVAVVLVLMAMKLPPVEALRRVAAHPVLPARVPIPAEGTARWLVPVNDWHLWQTRNVATAHLWPLHDLPWDSPFPAARGLQHDDVHLLRPDRGPAGGFRRGPRPPAP